jgi:hypothetical protein
MKVCCGSNKRDRGLKAKEPKSSQTRDSIGFNAQDEVCLAEGAESNSGGIFSESRIIRAGKEDSQSSGTWHMCVGPTCRQHVENVIEDHHRGNMVSR